MAGTIIRGTVRSRSGEPIVEARVYITKAPVSMPDIAALTNEQGEFSLHGPVPGSYHLECTAEGFLQESRTIVVEEGQPEVSLILELAE